MSDRTPEFEQIIELIVVLRGQIEFLLNNYIIDNQELFDFFKRLEMRLALLRNAQPGYDESKPLCRFLWELCAGFSFIDDYRGYDLIEKSIDSI